MKNTTDVYIRLWGNGKIPVYSSTHAAGCDLFATCDMVLCPGETKVMPLDFVMAMDPEMEAQIRPRSGLSLKTSLRVPNSPGTIDSDYRNTVGIILENTYNIANLPWEIAADPRILQKLKSDFKEMELHKYLAERKDIFISEANKTSILESRIYVDANKNPYGTVYIKKGDRIGQMVFCQYKRANFIPHERPEDIGEDRGGGFGHSG